MCAATRRRLLWLREIGGNILGGIGWGLVMATIFSLFVAGMAVLRGSTHYEQYNTTTFTIIKTYFAAGVLGGAVFGLLVPIARAGRFGAVLVGMAVGPFVYSAIGVASDGPSAFFSLPAVVLGVTVGGAAGWQVNRMSRRVI